MPSAPDHAAPIAASGGRRPGPAAVQTVAGTLPVPATGMLLPHEHLFLDLRGPDAPGYARADADEVLTVMRPHILELKARGAVGLVEWSTVGVGRNVGILARLAAATGLAVVAPTGVYTEPFAPRRLRAMSEADLEAWMTGEIVSTIDGTEVRAGFIKLASSPHGLTDFERRALRAAARAAHATGVAIGSHTTSGSIALEQIALLGEEGLEADRFVWAHAHREPDRGLHREAARRGAYVEFDNLGAHRAGAANPFPDFALADATAVALVTEMVAAGFAERVLLSHDAGWYDAGQPGGGSQRGFTYLFDLVVPRLRAAGLDQAVTQIVERNPWCAFARRATTGRGAQT